MTTSKNPSHLLPLIGWREWLSLPDLGVEAIKAKVDSGARSSALHTHHYEMYETSEGHSRVHFVVHPFKGKPEVEIEGDAAVVDIAEVKDSGGHVERRPFIETRVRLGESEWPISISLTNRERMLFRMLLGRTAIRGRFLIDSGNSFLQSRQLRKILGTGVGPSSSSSPAS